MDNLTSKHTIFWADDDQDDLLLFREVVEAHAPHHEVVEFTQGKELIDALQQAGDHDQPCLIVLDMNMPVFGGKDTLSFLKANAQFRNIPVVMFTTSSSALDKKFCDSLETEMITKPIAYDQMKNTIGRIIDLCGPQVQAKQAA
ncbi:CheY chemotaxis protein or a CheY-like REC (receiver) domain [Cnuella takakiae]|uniref:CheY chemotaxis protein or a CheY-like REC (Receiver) domain n=1 Tax=Cnuella takakiae TaxID=1302690 RepID=A0A1M4WGJ5_9BACT|nr:response regulator [Cnuella takakiae]OLY91723.1 hypothetical protein BUE76_07290 [Cnuella takakiae]SHE80280.1 CheY chemotaxis protein or a CheY-like REC (receiver) domain [Cnuella takakiae]